MTTWADLENYISANYKIGDRQPGRLRLTFDVGGMRSQVVFVFRDTLRDGTEEWFSIESPIGPVNRVDLRRALERVGGMVCGALAQLGEMVVLRHSAPLTNLDINEFERPLNLVVTSADMLERELVGGDDF